MTTPFDVLKEWVDDSHPEVVYEAFRCALRNAMIGSLYEPHEVSEAVAAFDQCLEVKAKESRPMGTRCGETKWGKCGNLLCVLDAGHSSSILHTDGMGKRW